MTDSNLIHVLDTEARANAPASVGVYPNHQPENSMGKLGAFALGVVIGAVGVVVTAAIIIEDVAASDIRSNPKSIDPHVVVDIA